MWIKGDFHVFIVATKNIFANCLHWLAVMSYAYPAPYKTGVGICSPKLSKATPDAASVFFVVRYMRHSMAWCVIRQRSYNRRSVVLLAYHAAHDGAMCSNRCAGLAPNPLAPKSTPRRHTMVTLTGQPQGWPVPFDAGTANPVNVTAPIKICSLSGDSLNQSKEAVYHG
ncbi:ash family protein [Salmonella enterica]